MSLWCKSCQSPDDSRYGSIPGNGLGITADLLLVSLRISIVSRSAQQSRLLAQHGTISDISRRLDGPSGHARNIAPGTCFQLLTWKHGIRRRTSDTVWQLLISLYDFIRAKNRHCAS